jgi:multidrug efflux pump
MTLTDIAVRRPVLAFVASALIIVFGFMGLQELPLREMPDVDRPIVSVSADYPGANGRGDGKPRHPGDRRQPVRH